MKYLPLTLPAIEANLALDEALLEAAELGELQHEVLRIWESQTPAVILGRSSRLDGEVNRSEVRNEAIPVVRRCSGGTTVVLGPGCLVYSLLLSLETRPHLRSINNAHQEVMEKLCEAIGNIPGEVPPVQWSGTCDLETGGRKFSGNSLRIKRDWILYHGTILYDFPIEKIERWLGYPPREPDYRNRRSHQDFLTNLSVDRDELAASLQRSWQAHELLESWPEVLTQELLHSRYLDPDWHEGK